MVTLVTGHQAQQNLFSVFGGGLFYHYFPKAALQRGIFLDGLAVFLRRGGTDELDLAPGQHRLQDAGGVDGPLGRTGPGDKMDLINKKDGAAVAVEFFQQVLEPLLKIAAVLGARNHRGHVQCQHPLAAQCRGDLAGCNRLGQRFSQGTFANARLAQQAGIVLLASAQNFYHAFQLFLPAQHRVQAALLRQAGQIAAVLFTGAAAAGGAHPGLYGQCHLAGKLAALPRGLGHLDACGRQPDAGRAGSVLQHGAEQVLVFGFGGAGCMGTQNGKLDGLAAVRGKVVFAQVVGLAGAAALGGGLCQGGSGNALAA